MTANSSDERDVYTKLSSMENQPVAQPVKRSRFFNPIGRVFYYLTDFSDNTTIHGVKYLGEKQRSRAEKMWWIIGLLVCMGMLGYFIFAILRKWDESPVVMSMEDKATPIYKIPFPAITLCPLSKINQTFFDYERVAHIINNSSLTLEELREKLTDEEIFRFESMLHICHNFEFDPIHQKLWKGHEFMGVEYIHAMRDISLQVSEVVVAMSFNESSHADAYPVLTEEGDCVSVNLLTEMFREDAIHDDYKYFDQDIKMKHYNVEKGYLSGEINDTYPLRILAANPRHSLDLLVRTPKHDINYACRDGEQGYRLTLNSPAVYPQPSNDYILIPHGTFANVVIKPYLVKTSRVLDSYTPERRQCFYNHERRLRFYNYYNEYNCKAECIANRTLKACGCVKFSLPRGKGIPICGSLNIDCYAPISNDAENTILQRKFQEEYFGEKSKINHVDECNCLPECYKLDYNADVEKQTFDSKKWLEMADTNRVLVDSDDYIFTRIRVYFKSTEFYAYKRSELYGFSDFVSNFGGLLGLFMGGSILSLLEIIYFCTIRIFCNKKKPVSEEVMSELTES